MTPARRRELARIQDARAESASLAAMSSKPVGRDEPQRLQGKAAERLAANPHLVSDEVLLSPSALVAKSLTMCSSSPSSKQTPSTRPMIGIIKGQQKNIYVQNGPLGSATP